LAEGINEDPYFIIRKLWESIFSYDGNRNCHTGDLHTQRTLNKTEILQQERNIRLILRKLLQRTSCKLSPFEKVRRVLEEDILIEASLDPSRVTAWSRKDVDELYADKTTLTMKWD
jgi:hypothetical protein